MSPPLSREDIEAIARIVDKRVEEKLRPRDERLAKVSGGYRELGPQVKAARESQHDIEDRSMGFENLVINFMKESRQERAEVREKIDSLPPLAKGTEAAAVVGAKAALATQGTTKAVQVAADRADTQSLSAKRWSQLAPVIVIVAQAVAIGIWQAIVAIMHAAGAQ